MTPEAETAFVPNDETDDLRWATPQEALELLTYDRDREVLSAAAGAACRRRGDRGRRRPTAGAPPALLSFFALIGA